MRKDLMETKEIIKYMTSAMKPRNECLDLALDRGLGEGMQIEKWILIEMLAKLIQLRKDGFVDNAEGEHKYPIKKTSRYEHSDLWWCVDHEQHWLEVKTIVVSKDQQRGSMDEIFKDLDKKNRLHPTDIFHHLTIVFPVESSNKKYWRNQLDFIYKRNGLAYEANWNYEMGHRQLLFMLFTQVGRQ